MAGYMDVSMCVIVVEHATYICNVGGIRPQPFSFGGTVMWA